MPGLVMRAAVTSGFGGPERLEVRDDVSVPEPAAGEGLVEVGACCCNNSDIWLREGAYGREDDPQARAGWWRGVAPPRFPLIQGADIVGRVVALGEEVEASWLGRRVLVDHTLHDGASQEPYGIAGIFGSERDGGFAEYATAPVTSLDVIEWDELSGNREIATQLFLSTKTVEMHLSRSYRKLDIASRGELASALAGLQPMAAKGDSL